MAICADKFNLYSKFPLWPSGTILVALAIRMELVNVDHDQPQGAFPQNLDHRFEQCSRHFLN